MSPSNFCTRCGSKLDEKASFCANCGSTVGPIAPQAGFQEILSVAEPERDETPRVSGLVIDASADEPQPETATQRATPAAPSVLFGAGPEFEESRDGQGRHKRIWVWALVAAVAVFATAVFVVRGRLAASTAESSANTQTQASVPANSMVAEASTSGVTQDAKRYVFKKHWRIGDVPCNYLGGAYSFFDEEHGEVLVAQGVAQYPTARTKAIYSDVSGSGFTLTMTSYANDFVANLLNDRSAVSGTQIEHVKLISGDKIEKQLETTILDMNALQEHVKKYDVKNETSTMTACAKEIEADSSQNNASHTEIANASSGPAPKPNVPTASLGYAEFSASTITSNGISVTPGPGFAYYSTFGGNWRITTPGGGFRATFDAPQDGKYDLAVTHLTSAAPTCPGNGFSPITIALNSQIIVENYDPAQSHNGSHDFVTDHWILNLHEGQNLLAWTAGNLCTHYWIQRMEIQSDTATTGSGT